MDYPQGVNVSTLTPSFGCGRYNTTFLCARVLDFENEAMQKDEEEDRMRRRKKKRRGGGGGRRRGEEEEKEAASLW